MKMNAVILGATGQIGQALIARASDQDLSLHALSHRDADITNESTLRGILERVSPSIAINLAGYTAVDRAEHETALANKVNADGAAILAAACSALDVPLIHLSTDYVFDGEKKGAYTESDIPRPINAYGRSKLEGEKYIRATIQKHVILRTSWVYGIYGDNFLKTIVRLAQEHRELRVVNDQCGCPTSSDDIADAILDVANKLLTAPVFGTYHFAGEGRTNWHEFACEIVKRQNVFTGFMPDVTAIPTSAYPLPARRPLNSELNSELFASTFGYGAKPWRNRVAECVNNLFAFDERSRVKS